MPKFIRGGVSDYFEFIKALVSADVHICKYSLKQFRKRKNIKKKKKKRETIMQPHFQYLFQKGTWEASNIKLDLSMSGSKARSGEPLSLANMSLMLFPREVRSK